ncbi:MAG: bifunctional phosphopantothenoylcysteine decarboxylase/phosphopantothenate--cysteine ligase CoaBC [Ilumatobacteraceae bacterium]|nr:bifunctional phosphopantothenoylcysteine decarboxylase/phosphopantothenate--cysteine ligase CoaBC [Ilumatobacteraceae bacterium]
MLAGKRIVLGVTGGIAAYKAVEVSRRLVDAGAHVVPVMTEGAERFLGPTTLSALASEPVKTRLWDDPETPIPHTKLGQGADLILVAPATARLIAALRMGLSTDLLTNVLLATRAPVMICPAMHTEMWEHPAVVDNIATLRERGVHIVDPEAGRLAGGDVGAGRLASPESIVSAVEQLFTPRDLAGVDLVVSAGGTREPIDAVRVIANRSSGKQGYAIAAEAALRGANVTIVSTVDLPVPHGAEIVPVDTAADMEAAMQRLAPTSDVVIMAAAVADFRPKVAAPNKLKKHDGVPEIVLEPTPDILAGLGAAKPAGQVLVGFAAETDDLVANAERKLAAKHLDLIVANDVGAPSTGFRHDTNAVTILAPGAEPHVVPLADKRTIAASVIDRIVSIRDAAG